MVHWPKNKKERKTSFGGLTRSVLMSRIRGSGNATTELKFLLLMQSVGLRGWRRNFPLIGKPDFAFPKAKLALFIDGCFWHGHNCSRNLNPKHNAHIWAAKLARNKKRDLFVTRELKKKGWKVVRVWECSLLESPDRSIRKVVRILLKCGLTPGSPSLTDPSEDQSQIKPIQKRISRKTKPPTAQVRKNDETR